VTGCSSGRTSYETEETVDELADELVEQETHPMVDETMAQHLA
jgi:hypothetical protein